MPKKNGFTILELLIIIAIISILVAVALPNFISARNRAIDTASISFARQVVGWLAAANIAATTPADQADLQDIQSCTDPLLFAEGAPENDEELPVAVSSCAIIYNFTTARYIVTVTSQTGYQYSAMY